MQKSLLKTRFEYRPFEYPEAYTYWEKQQQSHWLHHEVQMSQDITDWSSKLSETDKQIIGSILKGFTQAEIIIGGYWSNKVANWFKKPEIQLMANAFSAFEGIHQVSYAYLNDSLGFEDYTAFVSHPPTKDKLDRIINLPGKSNEDKALSLAIFSAFNEGVNLFSSFLVLLNYSRFNLLKGVGQIIAFSCKDETLHSDGGCWLFNTFISENPKVKTSEFDTKIYEAAELTRQLEFNFIDSCFELGNPPGLTKEELKQFIDYRLNTKLIQIGYKAVYPVDKKILEGLFWFDVIVSGTKHADFFSSRVDDYSRGVTSMSNLRDRLIKKI